MTRVENRRFRFVSGFPGGISEFLDFIKKKLFFSCFEKKTPVLRLTLPTPRPLPTKKKNKTLQHFASHPPSQLAHSLSLLPSNCSL